MSLLPHDEFLLPVIVHSPAHCVRFLAQQYSNSHHSSPGPGGDECRLVALHASWVGGCLHTQSRGKILSTQEGERSPRMKRIVPQKILTSTRQS